MAGMLPVQVYGLKVPATGEPIPGADSFPATFRITMAAIDPSAESEDSDKPQRATLKIIRVPTSPEDDEEDDEDYEDNDDDIEAIKRRLAGAISDEDEDMEDSDEDSEDEKNGGPSDPAKAKQAKKAALSKKMQEELDDMELDQLVPLVNGKSKGKAKALGDDISSDEDDESDEEIEELVICTLDPEKHYQQPLDITVNENEEVFFAVNGTHDIYLTGNYMIPPEMDDDEDDEDEDDYDGVDYDLSPDEDEVDGIDESEEDELDGLADPRIKEVDSDEEEAPKLVEHKKNKNKRPAESSDADEEANLDDMISKTLKPEAATNGEQKLSKKQAKKLKKNDGQAAAAAREPTKKDEKKETPGSDKKKVQFAKELEQGPTGSPKVDAPKEAQKTGPRNVNGVTIDDKKTGKGRAAKKGDKIEMRYIGKLKNGKVFDSNKKGKPFSFKLGVGEVIKGWDVGVVGMTAGGERRLTIPAKLAYGSQKLPDIPPNSDLVFDIKCMSVS